MNKDIPDQQPADDEFDEELVLTFLSDYHAFEQVMVRAGFTRAGRVPGNAQPDWEGFARHIESRVNSDSIKSWRSLLLPARKGALAPTPPPVPPKRV